MKYIVLDLEWNQCPDGKDKENKDLPFEIIEIGAVMLDSDRHYVDSIKRIIAPQVYHSLHPITKDLVHITMDELNKGMKFDEAAREFFKWCGKDYIFTTWGSMDLTELQRNCKFFEVEHELPMPLIYYDLQKSFSICYDDGKSRISLETAICQMDIDMEESFHSAMSDAKYTARIMEKMDFECVKEFTSVDTYKIPTKRSEEYTICYPTYSKYISMGYPDKDTLLADVYIMSTKCYLCGKSIRKKIKWFSTNQKTYYCVAKCENHGYIKGRMKIKKNDEGIFYAMKILKQTDEKGVVSVREKQLATREKRREKRHKDKLN